MKAVDNPVRAGIDRAPATHRLTFVAAILAAALSALSLGASQGHAQPAALPTGFSEPFAGVPKYEQYAPTEATSARQVNRPLGVKAANRIARLLGLDKRHAFTPEQFKLFIAGKGEGGEAAPARLVDESVRILTNSTGNPLFANVNGKLTPVVVGSYGLMVNRQGVLESPANIDAPTRQVNTVIEPGGYMSKWCRANGAEASLRMLYRSAYTGEVVYGNKSQHLSEVHQLIPNQKSAKQATIVGMAMAPSIWIVNFALIYTLNPSLAAKMPAYWTPIPANVALAIASSPTGQVPYSEYAQSFPG